MKLVEGLRRSRDKCSAKRRVTQAGRLNSNGQEKHNTLRALRSLQLVSATRRSMSSRLLSTAVGNRGNGRCFGRSPAAAATRSTSLLPSRRTTAAVAAASSTTTRDPPFSRPPSHLTSKCLMTGTPLIRQPHRHPSANSDPESIPPYRLPS